MNYTTNFTTTVMRTQLRNFDPFFNSVNRVTLIGSRYRSRVTGLADTVYGYMTLLTGYLHIVRPEYFNVHMHAYCEINSYSVTMDTLNTEIIAAINSHMADNRATVETHDCYTPLNITFLNVPYSTQLKEYVTKLLAHETSSDTLNTNLVEQNYVPLINTTFEYSGTKHTVCVLQHKYSSEDASNVRTIDKQYIVLTSNMSDIPMCLVFKAIESDFVREMSACSGETADPTLTNIYIQLFEDLCLHTGDTSFDTSPYVQRLLAHFRENQFKIDIAKMTAKLDKLLSTPVKYKDNTTNELDRLRNQISEYQDAIADICRKMDAISAKQYTNKNTIKALDAIRPELERMLKDGQLSDCSQCADREGKLTSVQFKFDVPIKIWETDEAENYIKYKRSLNHDKEHTFAQKMFEAIFLKREITMYNTCWVMWELANYNVRNPAGTSSTNDTYRYLPHMHINRYNCFGNVGSYITQALRDYDYQKALAYTLQTAMQYNFGDNTVMNHVFLALCPTFSGEAEWDENKLKKYLEYKGKFYSPQEFWEFYQEHETLEIDKDETVQIPSGQATEPAAINYQEVINETYWI